MTPYKHQEDIAHQAYDVLAEYGLVYLAMEERTGKSLTAIRLAEITSRTNVLVLTKKKALGGWNETLKAYAGDGKTSFTVRNYHAIHKAHTTPKGKRSYKLTLDPTSYDLIILDESHSYLSAYPKVGAIWKSVKKLCKGKPLVYLSATPNAQGYQLLYNQLSLSDWTPYKRYTNFYRWFEEYGIPSKVRTSYGLQETYKKCKEGAWTKAKHLFITYTRMELGFTHEPTDNVHYFDLSVSTKKIYNDCIDNEMLEIDGVSTALDDLGGTIFSPLDSSMKLRTTLHMLEGGVAKVDDDYIVLYNDEKIQAILSDFGDSEHNVMMYHYKAELIKLEKYFKNMVLLQATSYAEGVDLSMYNNLIIYSQDFSTARHSQRRARQANMKRTEPINVHFYLVKGAISEQVYKTVSLNKENFVDSTFTKETL